MLARSKFFLQFVQKIEKVKSSSSKQHNKMPKMRFEMLKTRNKGKTSIKLAKFSGTPRIFGIPGIFRDLKLKIREKGSPSFHQALRAHSLLNQSDQFNSEFYFRIVSILPFLYYRQFFLQQKPNLIFRSVPALVHLLNQIIVTKGRVLPDLKRYICSTIWLKLVCYLYCAVSL